MQFRQLFHIIAVLFLNIIAAQLCYGEKTRVIELHIKDATTLRPLMCEVHLYQTIDSAAHRFTSFGKKTCGVEGIASYRMLDTLQTGTQYFGSVIVYDRYEYTAGEAHGIRSEKYKPHPFKFTIPAEHGNPFTVEIAMERNLEKELEEVTVTATRIEFYHKGDTLIYNANAFKLSEGATLDALLSKMPGVELRDGGEIFCNGKKLDRLLINGRNLFNGKNELMLENIAAYTVKDIAVYKRQGRISELMGLNAGDFDYVMDVRLKREYSMGGTVNAAAGYGTHDRYIGKLFGMWFSDFISLSAYGNLNNLSNDRTPGAKDNSLTDEVQSASGVMTSQRGGLTYNANGYKKKWEVSGNIDVLNKSTDIHQTTNSQNFYESGDVFGYTWDCSQKKQMTISTSHHYYAKLGNRAILDIWPEYKYGHDQTVSSTLRAQYRTSVEELIRDDVLNSFGQRNEENDSLINRYSNELFQKRKSHFGRLKIESNIKLSDKAFRPTMLTLTASAQYEGGVGNKFQKYRYNFGDTAITPIMSHLYRHDKPDDKQYYMAKIMFTHFLDYMKINLPIEYTFDYTETKHNSQAYLLSSLHDYGVGSWPLDSIPAQSVYDEAMDPSQSYRSHESTISHVIKFSPYNQNSMDCGFLLHPEVSLTFKKRKYEYFTDNTPYNLEHHTVLPLLRLWFGIVTDKWFNDFVVQWRKSDQPLHLFVTRPSDGLNHFLGEENIRNSSNIFAKYSANNKNRTRRFNIEYQQSNNSLTMTNFFDSNTGETYYKPFYVDGNHSAQAEYYIFSYIDRKKRWSVTSTSQAKYRRSADFSASYKVSEDLSLNPNRHHVNEYDIIEKLQIKWKKGIADIGVTADAKFSRYQGDRDDFVNINAWACNYGVFGILTLPHHWSISTDMTMYTRRGYLDSRINTTKIVWNARVAKSILNGSLVFIFDGYDMLRQLDNVTYTVDAQARTEVTSNVLPSYFLFRMQWYFNKQPKRK